MEIGRRTLLKVLGAFPLLAAGISGMWQRIAFAATPRSLALRKVTSSDAATAVTRTMLILVPSEVYGA